MGQYRLLYNPASPFARKVWVAAKLMDIEERLELVTVAALPHQEAVALTAHNPLGKIPTLILEDGSAVYDSRVIIAHLAAENDGGALYAGEDGRMSLQLEALGDGLSEAAVALRYETFARPEAYRWPELIARQELRIKQAAKGLDALIDHLEPDNIGGVATIVALDYVGFRVPDLDWQSGAPTLAAWYAQAREGEAYVTTRPS